MRRGEGGGSTVFVLFVCVYCFIGIFVGSNNMHSSVESRGEPISLIVNLSIIKVPDNFDFRFCSPVIVI